MKQSVVIEIDIKSGKRSNCWTFFHKICKFLVFLLLLVIFLFISKHILKNEHSNENTTTTPSEITTSTTSEITTSTPESTTRDPDGIWNPTK